MTKFIYTSKIHLNQSINCLLIEKKQELRIKKPKEFIDYSQTIDNVYENLEDYNPTKKKSVKAFDGVAMDMESNEKLSPIVT